MIEIQTMDEWDRHLTTEDVIVVKFYTTWCPDCKRIDPFLPEVECSFQNKLVFLSVDRDRFPQLGEDLNIFGIPSFISFYKGKELIRFVSREAKTRPEIEHFLERTLQMADVLKEENSL